MTTWKQELQEGRNGEMRFEEDREIKQGQNIVYHIKQLGRY